MGSEVNQLHVIFFPLMAHGHMIPLVDMAKLFASRGLRTTIVTTPLNVPLFSKTVQRTKNLGFDFNIRTIEFSTVETGLPEGCENADLIISQAMGWEMVAKFFLATAILQEPFERLLEEIHPDCLKLRTSKFGIPRLVFHGASFFSLCVGQSLRLYEPHKKVSSDCEPFFMPNLADDITLTRNELPRPERHDDESDFNSCTRSYGVFVNSFYELEPAYADHYRKAFGRKAWHVGPVSLCNRNIDDKAERGREASINENDMVSFNASQLKEIANGLEASGQQFIWVVKNTKNSQEEEAWIGVQEQALLGGESIKSEALEKAVSQLMEGEEAEEMRSRAAAFGKMARKAVEEGGSSYSDLSALLDELSCGHQGLGRQVHIFFFPFMAHGHMIPSADMARLFASRGVKTTIITTPLNAPFFSKTIQKTKDLGFDIDIQTIQFPAAEAGLPEGCENTDAFITNENAGEMTKKFFIAAALLQEPFEKVLQERHPDCIVADMFFPWATDAAAKFGIPRLVFHGTSNFALCAGECVRLYEPHKKVSSDSEPFVVPSLPGDIKLTRKQLPAFVRDTVENDFTKLVKASKESELRSFGVVVNSFYELEPAYADHYRKVLGRRAWNVGPIATGLEASGQQFIWAVRRNKNSKEEKEDWLPEGFEERMEGKGLIIRGWAPQVLILDHEAIGAFVTHCGWNSTLESITAGKPMVTWPVSAEQFYNEKLVTDVLKAGVAVGVKEWGSMHGNHVKSEAIEKAITRIMVGEEADEKRSRARKLGETARKTVEKGGSSCSDLSQMGSLGRQLHIFFFPFLAHGHMIPSVDMARLFASRGVKTTIITTPLNAPFFSKTIQKTKDLGFDIDIQTIKFPAAEAGLPEGCENAEAVIANENAGEMTKKFFIATDLLQEPLEKVLQERHPDCIVADMFFPWATDAAAKFGIPRLVFHGTSNFALCAGECVRLYEPHNKFHQILNLLPCLIFLLTRKQLPDFVRENVENEFTKVLKASKESELRSFGVVVNSFYELEPAYTDHHRKVLGRRAWNVGPVSLCNRDIEDKSLKEIATGLEASGQQFIWVVNKGLIIRGWAPQVLILDHEATGAFVTHCGWNSTLEGITAGKPMITWPVCAEQFYNEKLVTDVLKTGVAVGVKEWVSVHGDHVRSEAIEKAITRIMVGVEATEKRSRTSELGETARKAVEEGGSSFSDFNSLIEELRRHRS
ncbi:hypothetical protein SADUNF_Sadunf09G0080000 [Salix dunnii]|uniref:anthocyanidin 3-O-glucosyltransferase n=1 Tax=Salix dunnii TaxID=1413687 RepID=A0A835JW81_9ROSI|nr:hypothetical protein SADUNF_Sadunf09G0080000 [Salix dunnii]